MASIFGELVDITSHNRHTTLRNNQFMTFIDFL